MDPTNSTIKGVLDFLTNLFENGLQYRTIGVYRSAISAYHEVVGGKPIGQHQDICTFMAGVDNLRPPKPKYCTIWEVEQVLTYLKKQEDSKISDKDLTLKTAMLLALTSVKRASEMHLLNIKFMSLGETKIVFQFGEKPKHFRKKGKRPDPVNFYASGEVLCPVQTLKHYLNRTQTWRNDDESSLFLSFIKPHKPVTTSTISRWLKSVLENVGVDTSVFKGHSTRAASSSKVFSRGATIEEILKCGNWSRKSTWQTFYQKDIDPAEEFQKMLLK